AGKRSRRVLRGVLDLARHFTFLLNQEVCSAAEPSTGECALDVKERKNCGYPGVSEKECIPWCFHPRIKKGECDVQPKARENCGYPGITEIECSARQCCFNSDAPDSPWCFKPVPAEGKSVKDVSFFNAGTQTFICINPTSARC
uniref:P-type domain-containing protein n=1 Tax=Chelydra serpentina TaxID=8475 RepID=A0A8C3T4F0_CHESE